MITRLDLLMAQRNDPALSYVSEQWWDRAADAIYGELTSTECGPLARIYERRARIHQVSADLYSRLAAYWKAVPKAQLEGTSPDRLLERNLERTDAEPEQQFEGAEPEEDDYGIDEYLEPGWQG
jgi:hypothetical protein